MHNIVFFLSISVLKIWPQKQDSVSLFRFGGTVGFWEGMGEGGLGGEGRSVT